MGIRPYKYLTSPWLYPKRRDVSKVVDCNGQPVYKLLLQD